MFAANEDNEPNTELIADFDEIMMDGNEEEKSIVYNDDVDDDGDDGDIDGDNIYFSTSVNFCGLLLVGLHYFTYNI